MFPLRSVINNRNTLKLLRPLCVWDVTLPTTKTFESVLLCLHIFVCFVSWERTGTSYLEGYLLGGLYAWRTVSPFFFLCDLFIGSVQGHLIWRAIYLEGSMPGWLFSVFVCFVFLFLSCLRGWSNFLFATRWSTPFI